jgi:hypothetical protein
MFLSSKILSKKQKLYLAFLRNQIQLAVIGTIQHSFD